MAPDNNIVKPKVWIQSPCYNEELNLPVLYDRFIMVADQNPEYDFHFLFIDDHSSDKTSSIIELLTKKDNRFSGLRLANNVGSHAACSAGLHFSHGDCVIAMSSDLQDPPEIIPQLIKKWQDGAKIVWAVRNSHDHESALALFLSKIYWYILHKYVLPNTDARGADFFLVDRQVVEVVNTLKERNRSIIALISTLGFEQSSILYDKQKRLYGKSKWNFSRKIKFAIDSVLGFSHIPVRLMTVFGMFISFISLLFGIDVIVNYLIGRPTAGWSSVMLVVLTLSGVQLIFLGVIGEYIWRILDEVRGRPYFVVERKINL